MSEIAILGEDKAHVNFAHHLLKELGFRRLRDEKIPGGRGDGISHVLREYPNQVSALRVRSYQKSAGLVAILDADLRQVDETKLLFDEALRGAKMDLRASGERISLLIPKRTIETWIRFLSGNSINEADPYKNTVQLRDFRAAAKRLVELRGGKKLPFDEPPSLLDALVELDRILKE